MREYYELTKPGIVYGNALTALAACLFAFHLRTPTHINFLLLAAMLVGLSLSMAGACVINNIIDRDIDVHMNRTKGRPIAAGRISIRSAAYYAAILLILGLGILYFFTNLYAFFGTLLGVIAYLLFYTPAKRVTQHSTIIGSAAGAVPPVIGYTTVTHSLDSTALLLFLILVSWQMTHFFAIAIFRKDEYKNAHLPIMSVRAGVPRTKALMFVYALLFTYAVILLGYMQGLGILYLLPMTLISITWIALSFYGLFWTKDDRRWARALFFYSIAVILIYSGLLAFV